MTTAKLSEKIKRHSGRRARGTKSGSGGAERAGGETLVAPAGRGEPQSGLMQWGAGRSGDARPAWSRSTVALGLAGALTLWAAFPPLGWWPLAWAAPIFWLALADAPRLSGRRPYLALWAVGLLHWLLVLQGIRLAHWATYFGWVALSMYLAVYLPLFVGLTRIAVHRARWPLIVAAPLVWTALELARSHLFTGFSLALLGHSQVTLTPLIQVADLAGAYAVSFLMVLVSACLWKSVRAATVRQRVLPILIASAGVVAAIGYGAFRLQPLPAAGGEKIQVALIQSSADTVFEYNPERNRQVFHDYRELTLQAARRHPELDLIVWPESVYTANVRELVVEDGAAPPAAQAIDPAEFQRIVEQWRLAFEAKNQALAEEVNTAAPDHAAKRGTAALLVGTDVEYLRRDRRDIYNTAMLVDPRGRVAGRYFKMHPVMFGEYVPLGRWFPWLYDLTPLGQGLTAGEAPRSFEVAGVRLSPSICFECTVPHLIRRQIAELTQRGEAPDVLVSVTNDGWFHGSAILDLHLACAAFRAVENRRPMLIAANTGISAQIDGDGRVLQRVPPLTEGVLVCEVGPDPRSALYSRIGDFPAAACLLLTVGAIGWAWLRRRAAERGV